MDGRRFDVLSRTLANELNRRTALRNVGTIGVAALSGLGVRHVSGQDATPAPGMDEVATPTIVEQAGEFLFVQVFSAGTWAPKEGETDVFVVTLTGVVDQTIYFSDRPERIVGAVGVQEFLDALGFTPANPPNAAIVAQTDDGEDVVVVELLNPSYDATTGTLTYEARVLQGYSEEGLAIFAQRQTDAGLPASFGSGSLFIDDCPDTEYCCVNSNDYSIVYGRITEGTCWVWCCGCYPCRDYSNECNAQFSACNGNCTALQSGVSEAC